LFPQERLEQLFFTVSALVIIAYVVEMTRFVRALRTGGANGRILPALGPVLMEILLHRRFNQCTTEKRRSTGHLLLLLSFVGLAIMGTIVGIGTMFGLVRTPLPLLSPLKILANLCAVCGLAGVVLLIANRFKPETRATSTYFDWFFLLVLGSILLTGFLSEGLRLLQVETGMYVVYFIHLTLILTLFLSAPYCKFAHFLYRTVAMAATWELQHRQMQAVPVVESSPSQQIACTSSRAV
jgi:quinone-modifying oxidoreductase subunit QmoC